MTTQAWSLTVRGGRPVLVIDGIPQPDGRAVTLRAIDLVHLIATYAAAAARPAAEARRIGAAAERLAAIGDRINRLEARSAVSAADRGGQPE